MAVTGMSAALLKVAVTFAACETPARKSPPSTARMKKARLASVCRAGDVSDFMVKERRRIGEAEYARESSCGIVRAYLTNGNSPVNGRGV